MSKMSFNKEWLNIPNLSGLKKSGYKSRSIKDELRNNLIQKLRDREEMFTGIIGFEESVIPDIQKAILSRHNIILLGLRGQAKTKIARLMTELLDEYIPVVDGAELNDDPLQPISRFAMDLIKEKGDDTPIRWMHRSERYAEKLATPDVTTADLIGDVDPIKAATLRLPYSDERVIHYGLVPHSNRCIFVINELPDLQARIQVSLFNILQEGDIQIRGFKMRLPLDMQFIFTANPEDYTNRGTIITPLKDRIESQILTHYPKSLEISKKITQQEANLAAEQTEMVSISIMAQDLLEQIAIQARKSEFIDEKSGVSARLTISAYENLVSTVERRLILNNESKGEARVTDIWGVIPAITGKVELVYEGEQEGPLVVAHHLIGQAIKEQFLTFFPDPEKLKRKDQISPYQEILNWFSEGNEIDLLNEMSEKDFVTNLNKVEGLKSFVKEYNGSKEEEPFMMELVLYGLAEFGLINRNWLESGTSFKDLLSDMFLNNDFEGFNN